MASLKQLRDVLQRNLDVTKELKQMVSTQQTYGSGLLESLDVIETHQKEICTTLGITPRAAFPIFDRGGGPGPQYC